jgi:chorismate mutase
MSSPDQPLDLLRKEIDSIDTAIHDLIVRRGTIVEDIRKIKKQAGPALRPGREAAILRRLAAEHRGPFPLPALICLWREMMGGFTHMQEPVSAAVLANPEMCDRLVRIARNQYGSMTDLTVHPSASACVRAVVEGSAELAVLPLPSDGEPDAWWRLLMNGDDKTPRVVTRLPFVAGGDVDQALVIAPWERDCTASEASLVTLRLSERASRSRIAAAVAAGGFTKAHTLATVEAHPQDCSHIIEVEGDVGRDDKRIGALSGQFGSALLEAYVIGGYARQLAREDVRQSN